MKKILGIFSIVLIASIMFLNVNISSKSKTDVDIASLIATNVANAEVRMDGCWGTGYWMDECAQFPFYKPYCERISVLF